MKLLFWSLLLGYGACAVAGYQLSHTHGLLAGILAGWIGGGIASLALLGLGSVLIPRPARAASAQEREYRLWDNDLAAEAFAQDLLADRIDRHGSTEAPDIRITATGRVGR